MFDAINSQMVAFILKRIAKMGVTQSGCYNYYDSLSKTHTVLGAVDRFLISYILKNFTKNKTIHEFAGGACQLGHALSVLGYSVTVSEIDKKRFSLAVEMGAELKSHCKIINEKFQDIKITSDLLVCKNAVASSIDMKSDVSVFLRLVSSGSKIIICPGLYGTKNKGKNVKIIEDAGIRYNWIGNACLIMDGLE